MCPQILAGDCSSTGSLWVHSFLQASTALTWAPFHGLQVQICSTMYLHGQQGDNVPYHGLHHELQGKTVPVSRALPAPFFFTDLGVCRVDIFHIVLLLSLHCHFTTCFFPLLKYIITETLTPSLIGLALASSGSVLEPAGIGCMRHAGSFSQLLTEATLIAPLLP